jgi:hypothetical protein
MKTTNILYWVFTGLLAAFMFFSGVQNALITPESITLLTDQLGYPRYIIAFLGVAKMLGAIAILIPGFPRIKEWAYAGIFFDLLGATYSLISSQGFDPSMLGMALPFVLFALSYIFYHKKMAMTA